MYRSLVAFALALLCAAAVLPAAAASSSPVLWPTEQREFFLEGPAWLLDEDERQALADLDTEARAAAIERFWTEAATAAGVSPDVLAEAVERRRGLVESAFVSYLDVRARLLFLNGVPAERLIVDCGLTFELLEIWGFDRPPGTGPEAVGGGQGRDDRYEVVVYQAEPGQPWRLWNPIDSKRVLYTSEMEYYLEQYEQFKNRILARRFDLQACELTRRVDRATGVGGLFEIEDDRPRRSDYERFVEPPADLGLWVERALAAPPVEPPPRLEIAEASAVFPEERGQRMVTHLRVRLPEGATVVPTLSSETSGDQRELRLNVQGIIERVDPDGDPGELEAFETFRYRFVLPDPSQGSAARVPRPADQPPPGGSFVTDDDDDAGDDDAGDAGGDGGASDAGDADAGNAADPGDASAAASAAAATGTAPPDAAAGTSSADASDPDDPPPAPAPDAPRQLIRPVVLVLPQALRPGQEVLVRLVVSDEVGGAVGRIAHGFRVPSEPDPVEELPPVPEEVVVAMGQDLAENPLQGEDSLLLVPPTDDVILGTWRAEALVSGSRIETVRFLVDGRAQLADSRPPYGVDVRLADFPKEQVVRAEGLDADDELVAADEVVLNQPRGAFRVRLIEPRRGVQLAGDATAVAEVVVPEGRRVEEVVFQVDNETIARLERPPWTASFPVPTPAEGAISFLTVRATLDDGLSAEDVRILNAPDYVEELDVDLVELYVAVTDRGGRLVRDLEQEEFTILDEGQPQEIGKFELVENLPLTIGIAIDTSGSMANSLAQAQLAATRFVESVVTPRDRAFAVAFANEPVLMVSPTRDAGAVSASLQGLRSVGATALHDAIVTSLYYFRGFPGQRALVVLSDGDDTASQYGFREALEFARRSGVAIYTIGLDVGTLQVSVRRKLAQLAEETGGRSFNIDRAEELVGVYEEIERELRSRYLLAFSPAERGEPGEFREVEVEVDRRGLEARTARGYFQ